VQETYARYKASEASAKISERLQQVNVADEDDSSYIQSLLEKTLLPAANERDAGAGGRDLEKRPSRTPLQRQASTGKADCACPFFFFFFLASCNSACPA
jgi:hypothetical protein